MRSAERGCTSYGHGLGKATGIRTALRLCTEKCLKGRRRRFSATLPRCGAGPAGAAHTFGPELVRRQVDCSQHLCADFSSVSGVRCNHYFPLQAQHSPNSSGHVQKTARPDSTSHDPQGDVEPAQFDPSSEWIRPLRGFVSERVNDRSISSSGLLSQKVFYDPYVQS